MRVFSIPTCGDEVQFAKKPVNPFPSNTFISACRDLSDSKTAGNVLNVQICNAIPFVTTNATKNLH